MLYSYQSQEPAPLSNRVRLSDGSTRTSLSTLSSSQLTSLGFTGPYTPPSYNAATQKVVWSSQDLQYQIVSLTQEELDAIAAQELQNKINNIDYVGFWNALIETPLYNKLRLAAIQDLGANTFCTELIALFADAKTGNSNVPVIQLYLTIIFFIFTFTEEELQDIQTLFESYNMLLVYTLPTPEYIVAHEYDPVTNTIIPV
jgi:hypothetical protein